METPSTWMVACRCNSGLFLLRLRVFVRNLELAEGRREIVLLGVIGVVRRNPQRRHGFSPLDGLNDLADPVLPVVQLLDLDLLLLQDLGVVLTELARSLGD